MSSDSNFSALLKFFCFSSQEKEASSTSHQFVENSEGAKHSTPSVSEWARSACCLCLVEEITRGFVFFLWRSRNSSDTRRLLYFIGDC